MMQKISSLIRDLPDAEAARRFLDQFAEKNPAQNNKLLKNDGLLSDVLTLVAFSPLLAATLLQNPNYLAWLGRHRAESTIRDKEQLLESLGRFALMNSMVEPQILLARFRRRELLRIFLHDIRRLATISEITEEISNLADAILEYALRLAKQDLDNRYGIPLETDEKGRAKPADFCVVSLGKLGSKELNYSSDIDLLFIYSADGKTSGKGTKGETTNREYFVKLAEFVTKLVGQQTGEGAAYRVDLRLRPHGRIGALALSVRDTIRYYRNEARKWERQVLIRSRSSAGEAGLFRRFFSEIEDFVFSKDETVGDALENVRLSKEKINLEKSSDKGFDVKLGTGGIREIEFLAQALQLAYGGRDEWLRSAHTLITLRRLADRNLLTENELTELFDAYEFLRRLEHLLQMENGLQTHLVPDDPERRKLFARRMNCKNLLDFNESLRFHTANVNRIFTRIFSPSNRPAAEPPVENQKISELPAKFIGSGNLGTDISDFKFKIDEPRSAIHPILASLEKSDLKIDLSGPARG
jgi:glutamate-ammonia-ligase adenylyltransferase